MTSAASAPASCAQDAALIVVDLQQLDTHAPIARCATVDDDARTGVQLLEATGFTVTGTTKFGRSFVCRIGDRPSATERLTFGSHTGYRESCTDTPPSGAYWSYWTATPGSCTWNFSTIGAASRSVTAGSAQGWSFALDTTPAHAPMPRVGPCDAVTTSAPTSAAHASTAAGNAPPPGRIDPIIGLSFLMIVLAGVIVAVTRRRRRDRKDRNA